MPRPADTYVCQSCGAAYSKWAGRCDACGEWNTIVLEETSAPMPGAKGASASSRGAGRGRGRTIEFVSLDGEAAPEPRVSTGNAEFDRACGGGLVAGSALLIGGDPGVGKSTLLLQVSAGLSKGGARVVYLSGEESVSQIRGRAGRLGLSDADVKLAAATALRDILATLKAERPDVVVIDSIQTLWSDAIPAAPGTVTQVRACAQELVRFAKSSGCAVLLVGHVTKDGQIAGPRVVEHMVDAVLYFESESGRAFRILRAVKNRFGAAHEIGVFEMGGAGLREVANPSELFLAEYGQPVSGAAVFAGVEGTRPVLVEIQALVSPSQLSSPRRAVVGWDAARLSMVLAVLDARCGLDFARRDVYLSVAGGMRVSEPAADLAAAAALVSSMFDAALPADCAAFGEIGLSGAVRPAPQASARMKEAAKLGFSTALCPAGQPGEPAAEDGGIMLERFATLAEMVAWIGRGAHVQANAAAE